MKYTPKAKKYFNINCYFYELKKNFSKYLLINRVEGYSYSEFYSFVQPKRTFKPSLMLLSEIYNHLENDFI